MRMRCLKEKEVCDASILHKKRNEGDLYEFKRSTTNNLKLKGKDFFFMFRWKKCFMLKKMNRYLVLWLSKNPNWSIEF